MGGMKALVVQNASLVGPGLLQDGMEEGGWRLDIRVMDRPGAVLPGSLEGYDALVVLGGPMSANEEETYPFLRQVVALVKNALRKEIPVLGTCLGGQLVARALGAPVTRNPVPEIGWYGLRLTGEGLKSPLFEGLPEEFPVFHWHEDTFALPAGAVHLARTGGCVNQAFSFGRSVFALQFHLEITPEIIDSWAAVWGDELETFHGQGAHELLKAETRSVWDSYKKTAGTILKNWLGIASRKPDLY
ncbi:MAG TPA: type 1 glutamine amidotransferase [Bacillota bacterium]|nr:type 1 glutamine amidotransferase [Bacillota bacterium]